MSEYVDATIKIRIEAAGCVEAIDLVGKHLGEDDTLAVNWPDVKKVEVVE